MSTEQQLQKIADWLHEQATPRALAGVAILTALLSISGLFALSDFVSAQSASLADLQRELALQRSISQNSDWVRRAEEAAQARRSQEQHFWRGSTTGIVAAQLQNTIETLATEAGLDNARVAVQPAQRIGGTDVVLFEIRLTSRDRDGQFLSFMQAISRVQSLILPVSFEWRRANGNAIFEMQAPAIIEPQQEPNR